jgi:hypothetical protein
MSEAAAAIAPAVQGSPTGDGKGNKSAVGLDALVNDALGAMNGDMGAAESTMPEMSPVDQAATEEPPELYDDETPEVGTKGTKEDPLAIQDLQSDRFVKIKVDGTDEVVSLRELGNGYIREQTFRGRVQRAGEVVQEAADVAKKLNDRNEDIKVKISALIENGDTLFRFMMGNEATEAALRQAALHYAKQSKAWRENPRSRLQLEHERAQARHQQERKEWFETKTKEEKTLRQREENYRIQHELSPAYEAGLRESGFPDRNDQQFQQEVRVRVAAVSQQTGRRVTPAELKQCVIRAAKFCQTAPEQKKPTPIGKPTPRQAPPPQRQQQARPGAKPPRAGSVEAILAGLKPMRF